MDLRRRGHTDTLNGDSDPRSAAAPQRVEHWEMSPSVYGRGTVVYGPVDKKVSVVLAPPSVPLPTPPDWAAPLASSGWRAAWMMPLADGSVILDEQEPFDLDALSFADAVAIVIDHCPQYLPWMADQVMMRVRNTASTLRPDRNGVVPAGAGHREAALVEMLAGAEEAVMIHGARLSKIDRCGLDSSWLADLRRSAGPFVDAALIAGLDSDE
jgi:hypothetical protein